LLQLHLRFPERRPLPPLSDFQGNTQAAGPRLAFLTQRIERSLVAVPADFDLVTDRLTRQRTAVRLQDGACLDLLAQDLLQAKAQQFIRA
jgi:hypothetical protein